jgi:hypothetical protein
MALLIEAVVGAEAQGQDSVRTSTSLTAVTVGMPGVGRETEPMLFTLGMTFNRFRPNTVGPEIAFGTMPYLMANMLPVIGLRAGVAVPAVLTERLILLPSAGVGAVMVASVEDGGGGAAPSAYAGIAAVIGTGKSSAFRAGVTWHRFDEGERPIWLLEIGVVRPFRRPAG